MRLRREDDRLNLTAEMTIDTETGKPTFAMTSQPMAGLSVEDFIGAVLTITSNGKPSAFVTFSSAITEPGTPGIMVVQATGTFMAGKNTGITGIGFEHMEMEGKITEFVTYVDKA